MRSKRTLTLVLLTGLIPASLVLLWWLSPQETPAPEERILLSPAVEPDVVPTVAVADLDSYVGSEACADCHADIASRYARSGMARSWRNLDGKPVGDLSKPVMVDDARSGYRYRILREENRIFQQEERIDPDEPDHRLRVEAHYTIGSGNHAQAMATERNGYLHLLPLAWYSDEKRWGLNPGFEGFNHRFGRPIVPGCVSCHGEVARHEAPTRNRFHLPLRDGIGCERCHGPGKDHVAHWSGEKTAELPEKTIVNPARLGTDRANDVCLQCHLQGDVSVYQPGGGAFTFHPGERLRDHRLDFLVKTDKPETFGVASHGARLMRSACYHQSEGMLTCFRCHDPHLPIKEVERATFDRHCMDCHQPTSCSRPVPAKEKTAEGCVACHMPRRGTREGQHLVFTDHWIRKHPPKEAGKPEVLGPNKDVELVPLWPDADPHQVRLGCAYVGLHESMGPQEKALDRGLALLRKANRAGHADDDARYCEGSALISMRRGGEALPIFINLLKDRPDHHPARFRLGLAWDQLGKYDYAVREYEAVLKAAPAWMEPYPLLARLHLFREQPTKAIDLLDRQRRYNPDATTFARLALARHLRGEDAKECLDLLDEALRLDPRLTLAFLYRAHIQTAHGQVEEAIGSYRRALEIEPANPIAKQGLVELLKR